jgi:hypothetical protein
VGVNRGGLTSSQTFFGTSGCRRATMKLSSILGGGTITCHTQSSSSCPRLGIIIHSPKKCMLHFFKHTLNTESTKKISLLLPLTLEIGNGRFHCTREGAIKLINWPSIMPCSSRSLPKRRVRKCNHPDRASSNHRTSCGQVPMEIR